MRASELEEVLARLLNGTSIPAPEREYPFAAQMGRRFRFDFAWPQTKVFVEVEGGEWVVGRHNRPRGFNRDAEKYNLATLLGWVGLRFTGEMLRKKPLDCVKAIETLINQREEAGWNNGL